MIETIPVELVVHIFEYLDGATLNNVRLVSRGFKEAVEWSGKLGCSMRIDLGKTAEGITIQSGKEHPDCKMTVKFNTSATKDINANVLVDYEANGLKHWLTELNEIQMVGGEVEDIYARHFPLPEYELEGLEKSLNLVYQVIVGLAKKEFILTLPTLSRSWLGFTKTIDGINSCKAPIKVSITITAGGMHPNASLPFITLGEKFKWVKFILPSGNYSPFKWFRFDKVKILMLTRLDYIQDFRHLFLYGHDTKEGLLSCELLTWLVLKTVRFDDASWINWIPPSVDKLELSGCVIPKSPSAYCTCGFRELKIRSLEADYFDSINLPQLERLELRHAKFANGCTNFLQKTLWTLNRLDITVHQWKELGILSTTEFASSHLSELHLTVIEGPLDIDKIWDILRTQHLQSLIIGSNNTGEDPPKESIITNMDCFAKLSLCTYSHLRIFGLIISDIPEIILSQTDLERYRDKFFHQDSDDILLEPFARYLDHLS
jgi:hypothetical protein